MFLKYGFVSITIFVPCRINRHCFYNRQSKIQHQILPNMYLIKRYQNKIECTSKRNSSLENDHEKKIRCLISYFHPGIKICRGTIKLEEEDDLIY